LIFDTFFTPVAIEELIAEIQALTKLPIKYAVNSHYHLDHTGGNQVLAALGVPVYTTYGGRLGGVDEALIREGRLRPLTDPRALELVKRSGEGQRVRRDPAQMLELLMPV